MVDKVTLPGQKVTAPPLATTPASALNPKYEPKVEPPPVNVPPDVEAAKAAFEDSLTALNDARADRRETSIPLSDAYWAAVNTHRVAYLALKDSLQEIPLPSPPDSDLLHDVVLARQAILAGNPRATALGALLTGEVKIPIEAPVNFQPFVRASIPLGVKLETEAPQPTEEIVLTIPGSPTEPIPTEPGTVPAVTPAVVVTKPPVVK